MIELLVEFRPVNPYVFSRFVIGYLRIKIGEFRHFDKITETLFLHDLVGHGKFKVRAFLRIDGRPTVKTGDPLPLHFLRTEIFEKKIEFRQAVGNGRTGQESGPQIPACALLYGTDGEKHVHGLRASFGVAQTGNSCMACIEHQVFEIVRFVNEEVVNAHLPEIGHVIRPVFYILFQLFKFGLKVFLSFFQPLLYPAAHFIALLLEYGEIFFDAVYFLRIYFLLYFGRLGYFSKLVVCQDDTVPVIIFDVMEYSDTLLRGKVLLARIQYLGIRIGPLERVGYVMHIAFESDNHRLVRQSETFHLKGGYAHDEGFARTYLMVDYTAAVHLQHPYGISLAVVQGRYAQPFQVKERETLQGTVIIRAYIAVELAVVHVRKVLFKFGELFIQPACESRPYFIDFGVGKLDGLGIPYLYIIAFFILHGFCYVGHRVVQRMFQQVVSVITSFFPFHIISVGDVRVRFFKTHTELVDGFRIVDMGFCLKKITGKLFIYGYGYPPFSQIKIKQFETDRLRYGFLQGFQ